MSLIKAAIEKYESLLHQHKFEKPVENNTNDWNAYVNSYTKWLSEHIQIENELKKLKDQIRTYKSYKNSSSIFATIILDPIVVDVNDDIDFEFMQWYETVPIHERSHRLKKIVIDGFLQSQKY